MGDIVFMTDKPREVVSSIGRHKLYLHYDPDAPKELRWSWLLKVTQVYEYRGKGETPGECRVEAVRYSAFHDSIGD